MDEAGNSDEENYDNESFENDSEVEVPEISETEDSDYYDNDIPPTQVAKNSALHAYTRNVLNSRKARVAITSNDYVQYSSSDDENDVIISETIVEINTEPMLMEDDSGLPTIRSASAETPKYASTYRLKRNEQFSEVPATEALDNALNEEHCAQTPSEDNQESSGEEYTQAENTNESYDTSDSEESYLETMEKAQIESQEDVNKHNDSQESIVVHESDILFMSNMMGDVLDVEKLTEIPDELPSQISGIESLTPSAEKCNKELANLVTTTIAESEVNSEGDDDAASEQTNNVQEAHFDCQITSHTPTSFNSDEYAYHLNFVKKTSSNEKFRQKGPNRKSFSFSNERVREIERQNHILLKKILTQKPTYTQNPKISTSQNKFATLPTTTRTSSAAVNRKKKQRQIDMDNQLLKRKIEAISIRRPKK